MQTDKEERGMLCNESFLYHCESEAGPAIEAYKRNL